MVLGGSGESITVGSGKNQNSPGPQNTLDFLDGLLILRNMFNDLNEQDGVEGVVLKRKTPRFTIMSQG
jgi:hypothetical protein